MKTRFFISLIALVFLGNATLSAGTITNWIGGEANWKDGWSNGNPASKSGYDGFIASGNAKITAETTLTDSNLTLSEGGQITASSSSHLWFKGNTAGIRPTFTMTGGAITLGECWVGSAAWNTAGVDFTMTGGTIKTTDSNSDNGGISLRGNDVLKISGGDIAVNRIHVGVNVYSRMDLSNGKVVAKNLDFGYNSVGGDLNVTGGTLMAGTVDFHGRENSFLNISGGEVYLNTVSNAIRPKSDVDSVSTYLTGGTLSVGNYGHTLRNYGGTVEINTLDTIVAGTTNPVTSKYGTMIVKNYAQRGGKIVFDISDSASDRINATGGAVYLDYGTVVINNESTKTSIDLFDGAGGRSGTRFVMNGGDIRDWTYNAGTGVLTKSGLSQSEWNGTAWSNGNPTSTKVKAVVSKAGCTLGASLADGANLTLTDGGTLNVTAHSNIVNKSAGRASVEFRMDGGTLNTNIFFWGTDKDSSWTHFDISGGTITSDLKDGNAGLSLRRNATMDVYGDANISVGRIHAGVQGGVSQLRFYGDSNTKTINLDNGWNDATTQATVFVEENATLRVGNLRPVDAGHASQGTLKLSLLGGDTFVTTMNLGFQNASDTLTQTGGTLSVGTMNITGADDSYTLSGGRLAANTFNPTGAFTFNGGTMTVGQYNGNLTNQGGTLDIATLDVITYETTADAIFANDIGTTTINGNYTQGENGMLRIQFDGTQSDQLLADAYVLDGTLLLEMLAEPTAPTSYKIFGDAPNITGEFANIIGSGNPMAWSFDYLTGTVNYLPSSYVPEPTAWILMLLGFAGMRFFRKKT